MRTSKIIAALLALLGFSRCSDDEGKVMYGPPDVLMYGVVQANFVVKGAVTDADNKPLENIRVVLKINSDESRPDLKALRDTVYTDAKGKFETDTRPEISGFPWALIAEDVDGEENGGEFQTEEKIFNLSETEAKFDPEAGAYARKIDFTLDEKKKADENE